MKINKVADFPKLPFVYSKNFPVFYSHLMGKVQGKHVTC